MFSAVTPSSSRRISGAASSSLTFSGEGVERLAVEPLFLARTAALLLARDAVRTALARLVGRGLGLSTLGRTAGVVGGHAVAVFTRRVAGFPVEGSTSGDGGEDNVAVQEDS